MTGQRTLPSPEQPMKVARQLESEWERNGVLTLRFWRESWMTWGGAAWSEMSAGDLKAGLYKWTENAAYIHVDGRSGVTSPRPWAPNKGKISNLAEALAAITNLSDDLDSGAWIDGRADTGLIIPCQNGLLELTTRRLVPPTPEFFNVVATPFPYLPDAPEPREWFGFLRSIWPDDPQAIETLQEAFGYVISGRRDLQKVFLLVGPTRSGKGTIANVLTELVGAAHTCGPTLAQLGTNFGLAPLIGKSLGIIPDARMPREVGGVVENLLMISGQDRMTVDRKNREAWTGRLPIQLVIMSNELPRLPDAAAAIAGRMIVLRMTRSFLGNEDRDLGRRLLIELPGIFLWSLAGLDRLTKRGRFAEPESSIEAVDLLRETASPVGRFLDERCELGSEFSVTTDDLFAAWRTWCATGGRDAVGTVETFARAMYAAAPTVKRAKPRVDGRQVPTYQGIRLRPAQPAWGAP